MSRIAKRASDAITQTNSHKQNGVVEDLKLFQARKQVFLKQFLNLNFGAHFPPFALSRGSNNLHSIFNLRPLRYL